MKTSELQGAALDWAVCKATGEIRKEWLENPYPYSRNWLFGGSIIERESIGLFWDNGNEHWCASNPKGTFCEVGPKPLIAAMRCYVASKLGDDIELPEELK
jgi:hypothetical protein